jgi:hypothetical protein
MKVQKKRLLALVVAALLSAGSAGCAGQASSSFAPAVRGTCATCINPADTTLRPMTVLNSEPVWGKGWVAGDTYPVLRPDRFTFERLADKMAAEPPGYWTGAQDACLNKAWMKESGFDNYYRNDLFNGIANIFFVVPVNLPFTASTIPAEQAAGWISAEPGLQIGEGLADIKMYWRTPCALWAAESSPRVDPGSPPDQTVPGHPDVGTGDGSMHFDLVGNRIAIDGFHNICVLPPGLPVPPGCSSVTQLTTWPTS